MPRVDRILLAMDFSPCASEAAAFASELVERLGASVDVIYVASAGRDDQERHQATLTMSDELDSSFDGASIRIRGRVLEGDAAKVLVSESSAYDLVVVGLHGRTNGAPGGLGSVTAALVLNAACPVLVVRPPTAPLEQTTSPESWIYRSITE